MHITIDPLNKINTIDYDNTKANLILKINLERKYVSHF